VYNERLPYLNLHLINEGTKPSPKHGRGPPHFYSTLD
jgi:hypothetical protein